MPLALWIVPIILAAIATLLLAIGFHGRRVDDHPICRKCGFDLFGRSSTSIVCSECGIDLRRPRAIKIGRRERRSGPLRFGIPILLVCAGWLGILQWTVARGVDWNRHKPSGWLAHEARGSDTVIRDAALVELRKRLSAGSLSRELEATIINTALDHQGNWSEPWVAGWGFIVEAARDSNRLTDEQWDRYCLQALPLVLKPLQPEFRRSDTVQFKLSGGPPRVGDFPLENPASVGLYSDGTVVISNQPHPALMAKEDGRQFKPIMPHGSETHSVPICLVESAVTPALPVDVAVMLDEESWNRLGTGEQTARLSLALRPFRFSGADERLIASSPGFIRDVTTNWRAIPDVIVRPDEALRESIIAALDVHVWYEVIPSRDPWSVQIDCRQLPVDLGCQVVLQPANGKPINSFGVFFRRGVLNATEFCTARDFTRYDPVPRTVDIFLRTAPGAAPRNVAEIWGGELVFKGVPVQSGTRPKKWK